MPVGPLPTQWSPQIPLTLPDLYGWLPGDKILAGHLRSEVGWPVAWMVNRPFVQATAQATAVTTNAYTSLPLNSPYADAYGGWDGAGGFPTLWYAPWPGNYLVYGFVSWPVINSNGSLQCRVYNSSGIGLEDSGFQGQSDNTGFVGAYFLDLLAIDQGQHIELVAVQDTGGNQTPNASNVATSFLSARMVSSRSGSQIGTPGLPAPSTWTGATACTSALMQAQTTSTASFLQNPPVCRLSWQNLGGGGQTCPSGAWTNWKFDSRDLDPYNGSTASSASPQPTWTVPVPGHYLVIGQSGYPVSTGAAGTAIVVNGSTVYYGDVTLPGAGTVVTLCHRFLKLAAGDTLGMQCYQSSGSAQSPYTSLDTTNHLVAIWMAA